MTNPTPEPTGERDWADELALELADGLTDDPCGAETIFCEHWLKDSAERIRAAVRTVAAEKDGQIAAIWGSFDSAAAVLKERYERLAAESRAEGLNDAAQLVERWHIKKGGFGNLAEAIRLLNPSGEAHSFNPTRDKLGSGLCVECGKPELAHPSGEENRR